jgi:serine/threonine-protein kinase
MHPKMFGRPCRFRSGDTIPGTTFTVLRVLGVGPFGEIYRCRDLAVGRRCVVKIVPMGARREIAARVRREAVTLGMFRHENVVHVHSRGRAKGLEYFVMENVPGADLSAVARHARRRRARVAIKLVVEIGIQLMEALGAAHEQGLVHRDVKPANVMVEQLRHGIRVKLLDFGFMCRVEEAQDDEWIVGSVGYAAPEQQSGDAIDHRADLYAAGVVLYELAAGIHPFAGVEPLAVAHALRRPRPLLELRSVPQEFAATVDKAMAKRPEARYASAEDLAFDLRRIRYELTRGQPDPFASTDLDVAPLLRDAQRG